MNKWLVTLGYNNSTPIKTEETVTCGSCRAYWTRDGKFKDDELFERDEDNLVIIDGIILNLNDILSSRKSNSLHEYVMQNLGNEETLFFEKFKGPFSGVVFNRTSNQLIAFGNQTGDAPVFIHQDDSRVLISNDLNLIVEYLKLNEIAYSLDLKAIDYVLTFGYMIDDRTLISEIKRLEPGAFFLISDKEVKTEKYFLLNFDEKMITFENAIEELDKLFSNAVKRCIQKDAEYGYENHLMDMSGGFDSRMVNWVAKSLGCAKITNISYSQSFSNENKFASMAANRLGNDFIHKQLDNADFIYDIDRLVDMNYGLSVFCGITGGESLLRALSDKEFGVEHSGQLGDVTIGSYCNTEQHVRVDTSQGRYSRLLPIDVPNEITRKYKNNEEFLYVNRGFRGILSSHLIRRHYFYTVSPFLDVDFLTFCSGLPMKYKVDHKLYWAWVDLKYPEANRFGSSRARNEKCLKYQVKRAVRIIERILIKKSQVAAKMIPPNRDEMNPFDYWYATNSGIRTFINEYYQNNIYLLNQYREAKLKVEKMFQSSRTMDKIQALTVIAGVRRYFEKREQE